MTEPITLIFLCLTFFLAALIKGVVGLGLPAAAIGLMTFFLDPRQAIAMIILPMVVMNGWQIWRSGQVFKTFQQYQYFIAALMVGVTVLVFTSAQASNRILTAAMGGVIILFVITSATRFALKINDLQDRRAQITFGGLAGIIGGLTSIWTPPLAIYLHARGVTKDNFVRATGVIIFMGSLPLAVGYAQLGHLTSPVLMTSLAMLVPAFIGFSAGEMIRHRISEAAFRRVLLVAFLAIGLNLLRQAFT